MGNAVFAYAFVREISFDSRLDALGIRPFSDNSRAALSYGLLQASYIGDDHRDFKVVGNGADSALCGAAIGEDSQVGGREIFLYVRVLDVFREQVDSVFRPALLNLFGIAVE